MVKRQIFNVQVYLNIFCCKKYRFLIFYNHRQNHNVLLHRHISTDSPFHMKEMDTWYHSLFHNIQFHSLLYNNIYIMYKHFNDGKWSYEKYHFHPLACTWLTKTYLTSEVQFIHNTNFNHLFYKCFYFCSI